LQLVLHSILSLKNGIVSQGKIAANKQPHLTLHVIKGVN